MPSKRSSPAGLVIVLAFVGLGIAAASLSLRAVRSTYAAGGVGDTHQGKPLPGNPLAGRDVNLLIRSHGEAMRFRKSDRKSF